MISVMCPTWFMFEDNELHAIITCSFKLTKTSHSTDFVPCEIYNRKSFVLTQSLSHFSDQPSKTDPDMALLEQSYSIQSEGNLILMESSEMI